MFLKNNSEGKLLIYSILNDEYLNFKAQKNDISANKIVSSNKEQISIKGLWRISCGNALTTFDINDNEGYLSLYSFNAIYINLRIMQSSKINEYLLWFKSTESQEIYYKESLKIENDNDISKDKIIGRLVLKENGKA